MVFDAPNDFDVASYVGMLKLGLIDRTGMVGGDKPDCRLKARQKCLIETTLAPSMIGALPVMEECPVPLKRSI